MKKLPILALALGMGACAGQGLPRQTSVLITGGKVFGTPGADAVLIKNNRITSVGKTAELKSSAPANAALIEAKGGLILPGLHDAHTHLMAGGLASFELELTAKDKIKDITAKIT